LTAPAYWKFESSPLQRRVHCEPILAVNPMLIHGQSHGGIAQGIG
jgi:hypothetical protein